MLISNRDNLTTNLDPSLKVLADWDRHLFSLRASAAGPLHVLKGLGTLETIQSDNTAVYRRHPCHTPNPLRGVVRRRWGLRTRHYPWDFRIFCPPGDHLLLQKGVTRHVFVFVFRLGLVCEVRTPWTKWSSSVEVQIRLSQKERDCCLWVDVYESV